jgi:hypothetical protein
MSGGDMTKGRGRFIALVGCLLAVWSLASVVGAQTLEDAAKRERARRERLAKEAGKPKPTFSDDDLRARRPRGSSGGEAGAADAGGTSGSESGGAASDATSIQAYWQERLKSARDEVERAKTRVADLESTARAGQGAPLPTDADAAQEEASRRARARQDADAAKRDLTEAERALADLEKEASKSGSGSQSGT